MRFKQNWENLATAIIVDACDEYRRTYARCRKKLSYSQTMDQWEIRDLKKFFYGPVYEALTNLDPTFLLEQLEQEVEEKLGILERSKRERELIAMS